MKAKTKAALIEFALVVIQKHIDDDPEVYIPLLQKFGLMDEEHQLISDLEA
jgi:hypothetical protein